jgi:hypothetical protein
MVPLAVAIVTACLSIAEMMESKPTVHHQDRLKTLLSSQRHPLIRKTQVSKRSALAVGLSKNLLLYFLQAFPKCKYWQLVMRMPRVECRGLGGQAHSFPGCPLLDGNKTSNVKNMTTTISKGPK